MDRENVGDVGNHRKTFLCSKKGSSPGTRQKRLVGPKGEKRHSPSSISLLETLAQFQRNRCVLGGHPKQGQLVGFKNETLSLRKEAWPGTWTVDHKSPTPLDQSETGPRGGFLRERTGKRKPGYTIGVREGRLRNVTRIGGTLDQKLMLKLGGSRLGKLQPAAGVVRMRDFTTFLEREDRRDFLQIRPPEIGETPGISTLDGNQGPNEIIARSPIRERGAIRDWTITRKT